MFIKRTLHQERERKSTGVEEIDGLLGGGIKKGEMLLLVQQENVKYHIGMHRVFISQGLEDGEKVFHASKDNPVLPAPGRYRQSEEERTTKDEKIAWRYRSMSRTGNTTSISTSILSRAKRYDFKTRHAKESEVVNIIGKEHKEIIEYLEEVDATNGRLSISSLFSPIWEISTDGISDFLFHLRRIVKMHQLVCMVSVPVYLLDTFNFGYFDSVINCEGNSVRELKYDGLIQCLKTETNDFHKYALICQSTGIKVEKIVLPPE